MEWVETTGKTVEEAKDLALDQLGVDSAEAEFEVLEEPKVGLFGRTRGEARVRARIAPKAPRAKTERRRRPKKDDERAPARGSGRDGEPRRGARNGGETPRDQGGRKQRDAGAESERTEPRPAKDRKPAQERESMDIDEQRDVLVSFLVELAGRFGLDVTTETTVDDDELRVDLVGDGLGLLIGPRMATLDAIQEIARNTLQRQAAGREYARVVVDVAGIRQRRRAALTEFVSDAAKQVVEDDVTIVFDVMSSADRKQVHDVASELDGVTSSSEGEDPRRRVVLRKA